MTRRFSAHFRNGVLVPDEKVELPENRTLAFIVEEAMDTTQAPLQQPVFDDPLDPKPAGGVELVDWWGRHRLQIDPVIGDKIARAKAYAYYEEPDDES